MFKVLFSRRAPPLPVRRFSASAGGMASPFTQAVVRAMRRLYPEVLADKSFDNTGLLLEAPENPRRARAHSVLLTIDLTKAVADEAIANSYAVVVAYHPIIFRGLKALTLGDSQQNTLLRLASEGVGVYCPHTAVDAVPGGMADWLCDIVTGQLDAPEPETTTAPDESATPPSETDVTTSGSTSAESSQPSSPAPDAVARSDPFTTPTRARKSSGSGSGARRVYSKPTYPAPSALPSTSLHPSTIPHTRTVIQPSPSASLDGANAGTDSPAHYAASNTGAGRLLTFTAPQPLSALIERIARGVGTPKGFPVAIPQQTRVEDHAAIRTVAVCPGSGGGVLGRTTADLLFTGELSHHEALAVTERGGCVVTLFHSNSERGYLWSVMRPRLEEALRQDVRQTAAASGSALCDESDVTVDVSDRDRDPYGIVILGDTEVDGAKI